MRGGFGSGSDHIREKDGLWAVLFWLNILARRGGTVADLMREHWRTYGRGAGPCEVVSADEFCYVDPVDGSTTTGQGIRIAFRDGARIVVRLSGTGTVGATLRLYLEVLETDPHRLDLEPEAVLAPLASFAVDVLDLRARTGMDAPTVVT
ncbi:hypothetical protein BH24GEM1_BH24GEM1_09500 [soil metagenome]